MPEPCLCQHHSIVVEGSWLKHQPKRDFKYPAVKTNCWTVLKKDRTFMCNAVFAMNSAALSSRGLRNRVIFLWKLRFFLASVYKIWKWKFWFHVKIKWSWMLSYSISLLEGKKYVCLTPPCNFLNYTKPDIGPCNILSSIHWDMINKIVRMPILWKSENDPDWPKSLFWPLALFTLLRINTPFVGTGHIWELKEEAVTYA